MSQQLFGQKYPHRASGRTRSDHDTDKDSKPLPSPKGNAGLYTNGVIAYADRRAVVEGYRKFARLIEPTHILTFMAGRVVDPHTLAANVEKWCRQIERRALGRYWQKFEEHRLLVIGFLEKPDITPHYHAVAHIPKRLEKVATEEGAVFWEKLVPAGKIEVDPIKDLDKVISYVTKDLHLYFAPENVLLYGPSPKNR